MPLLVHKDVAGTCFRLRRFIGGFTCILASAGLREGAVRSDNAGNVRPSERVSFRSFLRTPHYSLSNTMVLCTRFPSAFVPVASMVKVFPSPDSVAFNVFLT
jgi:hypothetical protein